ncbi:MAG: hypothetical protein ABI594_10035 [Ginsengibacter sp.]
MTTKSHMPSKVTAIIAMVFLLPALVLFIMWSSIGLQGSGLNAKEKISVYLAKFPVAMQNLNIIHIISIACCLLATIFAARSFRKHLLSIRILMMLTVLAAMFILLFDIYQMV